MVKRLFTSLIFLVLACSASFGEDAATVLSFYHTHTHERFTITYREDGKYARQELENLNHFLRDFRTEEKYSMDIALLDVLYKLKQNTSSNGDIEIISAYRSAKTNEMLRKNTTGVVKGSLHLQGRAIDIRFSDVDTKKLRDVAKSLQLGGVGYYPMSDFIHIDTGRIRAW